MIVRVYSRFIYKTDSPDDVHLKKYLYVQVFFFNNLLIANDSVHFGYHLNL